MKNLTAMRDEIDVIDAQLIALLGQRFELTERVGLYKAEHALPAADQEREQSQYHNFEMLAQQQGISKGLVTGIFKSIIDEVVTRHKRLIN
ncbi:MAG: chorismate mutase [Oceanospirillaceae bacterium]|nr:chorismate mutase [Oceanospirillaceae bacterium]